MTSISGGSASFAAMQSPKDRMQLALQSAVSAGTVKSTDQTALAGPLDDIDSAMQASRSSSTGSTGSTASTGKSGSMKDKVDSLIDQEVSDGKLTEDQASELKKVFAQAAPHAGGMRGPHGPPPSTDDSDSSDDDSTTTSSTSSASSTSSTDSAMQQLVDFLKQLSSATAEKTTYGASGASTSSSQSILVNALA